MGRELSSEVQSEVAGAAVACLETKVNWCVAIRDEVALYEQKHHGAWEAIQSAVTTTKQKKGGHTVESSDSQTSMHQGHLEACQNSVQGEHLFQVLI